MPLSGVNPERSEGSALVFGILSFAVILRRPALLADEGSALAVALFGSQSERSVFCFAKPACCRQGSVFACVFSGAPSFAEVAKGGRFSHFERVSLRRPLFSLVYLLRSS